MKRRFVVACVVAIGAAGPSCSGSMDLGATEEFPGAGAATGWSSADDQPLEAVTMLLHHPYDLAMRNGRLFWTAERYRLPDESATVQSCLPGDCRTTTTTYEVVDNPPYPPLGPMVDDTRLFWLRHAMLTCPVSGCADKPVPFDTAGNVPTRAAMDDEYVYWTSEENAGVFKCPKTGCQGLPQPVIVNRPCPWEIELDDEAIYWHEAYSPELTCISLLPPEERPRAPYYNGLPGPVMRVAKDGTGLQRVFEVAGENGMALNQTHIYWTNSHDGQVLRCPKTGCATPEVVAAPGGTPWGLILDETSVYWLHQMGVQSGILSVMKCPLDGCETPTVLAKGQYCWGGSLPAPSAHALAQDAEYLYWPASWATETPGGAIWRVRK